MKSIIIILLLISSVCFGQKNKPATPLAPTKMDTVLAIVYNDSIATGRVVSELRNFVFKEIKVPTDYDYVKTLMDKFIEEKKKLWADFINKNK